jgi:hypothetical protein
VKKARGFNTFLQKYIPARENIDKTFGGRHTLYQQSKILLILLLEINELANPAPHVREAELLRGMNVPTLQTSHSIICVSVGMVS